MVSFTAASAGAIIAFGAMIEPIHAGPVAGVVDAVGAVSKGVQAASAIGSLTGSKSSSRRDTEAQVSTLFKPCFASFKDKKPIMTYDTTKHEGEITGLDQTCMHAFELYNDHVGPQPGHADVVISNTANSVSVKNIPPQFYGLLEQKFAKPAAGQNSAAAPAPKPSARPDAGHTNTPAAAPAPKAAN